MGMQIWMLTDVRTASTTSIESSIRRPHLRRRSSYENPEIPRLAWERELSPSAAEDIERFADADLRLAAPLIFPDVQPSS